MKIHHYFELSGLVIVLFATSFQLLFLSEITDVANNATIININQKIDLIWFKLNQSSSTSEEAYDLQSNFNNWIDNTELLEKQKNTYNSIFVFLMLIGSVSLVFGRWLEIQKENTRKK